MASAYGLFFMLLQWAARLAPQFTMRRRFGENRDIFERGF